LEGDSHSLATINDEKVRRHYQNGIGQNIVVVPESTGATHEYFPTNPIALGYLRNLLARPDPSGFANTNKVRQEQETQQKVLSRLR
jgi:hypothetical protein